MNLPFGRRPIASLMITAFTVFGISFFTSIATAEDTINAGAVWLIGEQDDSGGAVDGGFPWTVGGNVTVNTQGATALGLVRAYEFSNNIAFLNAAIENGNFIIDGLGGLPNSTYSDGDHRFATHDLMFLEELSAVSGDISFANFAQANFWDKLSSSSYGESNNLDAAGFGALINTQRNNQGNIELAPWDLSKTAIAAHEAGEFAARDALMGSILDGLNMSTGSDTTFDLHGLAGAIWASAVTQIDLDPTLGRFASADSTADLVAELLNWQTPGGGFVFNTTLDPNVDGNSGTQVTAFAMLALNGFDPDLYDAEISNALGFMRNIQDGNGQFLAFIGDDGSFSGGIELHGESLEAYAVSIPEPSGILVIGILAFGGFLMRRRPGQ